MAVVQGQDHIGPFFASSKSPNAKKYHYHTHKGMVAAHTKAAKHAMKLRRTKKGGIRRSKLLY